MSRSSHKCLLSLHSMRTKSERIHKNVSKKLHIVRFKFITIYSVICGYNKKATLHNFSFQSLEPLIKAQLAMRILSTDESVGLESPFIC